MTDIPAQPGAVEAADAERSTTDAKRGRASAAADKAAAMASEAMDKAGDAIQDAAGRAGVALHEAADRAGDAISDAADRAHEVIGDATGRAIVRIRNNATLPSERGTTTIANEVVEKIAGIAAREVPGVYDLGGDTARVLTAVRERFGLGEESKAQGVKVRLEGTQADLSITLVIEYGFVVSSICDTVREKAISSVETLLGLDVTNVDILVDDVGQPQGSQPLGTDRLLLSLGASRHQDGPDPGCQGLERGVVPRHLHDEGRSGEQLGAPGHVANQT
jgi:uncharacterized alkaline shock family protein YloU